MADFDDAGGRTEPHLPVSGVVVCQDEDLHIEQCLRSLAACREIIVVDSGSTDRTVPIIEALRDEGLPITLIHQPWLGYASQKQFAVSRATQPWCLSLDADERLDAALQRALPTLIATPEVAGWKLTRLPARVGRRVPQPGWVRGEPILRLVRREAARFDASVLVHEGLQVPGPVRLAPVGLIRHDRRITFDEQIRKELRYARLKATQGVARARRPSLARLLFGPPVYFFRIFILHRWFLFGRAGFVLAVTGAIYAFSAETTLAELWQALVQDG